MKKRLIWKGGVSKTMKIDINQLQNYYKIYCAKTPNLKHRFFRTFDEFSYIMSRVGMENSLKGFRRKTCNVSKIHQQAKYMLMFGDKEAFLDVDPDNVIPKCDTLEATLRLVKNKNIKDILEK